MPTGSAGATIVLTASTAKARAELDVVIAKAREAHGLTSTLPAPSRNFSVQTVRLPSLPGASVGGGKAEAMRSQLQFRTSDSAMAAAGLGGKSAIIPRAGAIAAAAERAQSTPLPPRILKPASAAQKAEDLARGQVSARIAKQLTDIELKRGGVDLGPLQLTGTGVRLGVNMAKLLGPAAGAILVGVGAVKALSELWEFESSVIAEAAKAGRDPRALTLEKAGGALRSGIIKVQELGLAGARMGAQADLEILRLLTGNSIIPSLPGWVGKKITDALGYAWDEDKAQQTARGAIEIVDNAIARVKGLPTSQEKRRAAWDKNTADWDAAQAKAQATLEEHSRKVAEQLLGAGFPGTRRELRELVFNELNPEVTRATTEAHQQRVNNRGIQEAGE